MKEPISALIAKLLFSVILLSSSSSSPYSVFVLANTEKTIFLGPDTVRVSPSQHPNLEDLRLDTLTPQNWSLRTALPRIFPTASHPAGRATWLLLDGLTKDQRYEVRICWAATVCIFFFFTHPSTLSLNIITNTQELLFILFTHTLTDTILL